MADFKVGDYVQPDAGVWYDDSEVGRIDSIEDGYVPVYHIVFDDGEYIDVDASKFVAAERPAPRVDPRDDELARLRAQVAALTAALKPFGDVWERFDETADTDATFSEWLVRSADLSALGNACARAYKLSSEL